MNRIEIELVQHSWASVEPIADAAAQLFYQRLFEIAPDTRQLFAATDMAAQRQKLLTTIGLAVDKADRVDCLQPVLRELGRNHVKYGVQDHHYDCVGSALLWTLEQGLGTEFTGDVRAAWTVFYALVTGPMREAATKQHRPAA